MTRNVHVVGNKAPVFRAEWPRVLVEATDITQPSSYSVYLLHDDTPRQKVNNCKGIALTIDRDSVVLAVILSVQTSAVDEENVLFEGPVLRDQLTCIAGVDVSWVVALPPDFARVALLE